MREPTIELRNHTLHQKFELSLKNYFFHTKFFPAAVRKKTANKKNINFSNCGSSIDYNMQAPLLLSGVTTFK